MRGMIAAKAPEAQAQLPHPFSLSLSKPVLSACLGRQSKGPALSFSSQAREEGQPFEKVGRAGLE
jgi:hypothetical protein